MDAIQYLSKYIKNLSAQTDALRKLLKKRSGNGQNNIQTPSTISKTNNTVPYLAHYNPKSEIILTTDASTKGLGATLWQKQKDGNLKPIGFASRFLSDTEKNMR